MVARVRNKMFKAKVGHGVQFQHLKQLYCQPSYNNNIKGNLRSSSSSSFDINPK